MKSLVIAMRRRESGAVELDLHGLARAIVEVVEHDVFGADQLLETLAQVLGDLLRRALALGALAEVDVHASAGRH